MLLPFLTQGNTPLVSEPQGAAPSLQPSPRHLPTCPCPLAVVGTQQPWCGALLTLSCQICVLSACPEG